MGVEYSRGATAKIIHDGPALAPRAVQKIFPNADWLILTPNQISDEECMHDRFGDAYNMHKEIHFSLRTYQPSLESVYCVVAYYIQSCKSFIIAKHSSLKTQHCQNCMISQVSQQFCLAFSFCRP